MWLTHTWKATTTTRIVASFSLLSGSPLTAQWLPVSGAAVCHSSAPHSKEVSQARCQKEARPSLPSLCVAEVGKVAFWGLFVWGRSGLLYSRSPSGRRPPALPCLPRQPFSSPAALTNLSLLSEPWEAGTPLAASVESVLPKSVPTNLWLRILCEPLKTTSYVSSPQFTPPYRTGRVKPLWMPQLTWFHLIIHSFFNTNLVPPVPCTVLMVVMGWGIKQTQFLLLWKIQAIKREATRVEESMVEISREMPAKL